MTRLAIVRDLADAPRHVDVPMTVPWLPLGAIAVTCLLLACLAALAGARTHSPRPQRPLLARNRGTGTG